MSLAASLSDPRSMMLTLVEAGAYLDFRNTAGQTAVHQAAKLGNDVALKVRIAAVFSTILFDSLLLDMIRHKLIIYQQLIIDVGCRLCYIPDILV